MKQEDLSAAKGKIALGFKDLSAASNDLKSAADDLSSTISELERLLRNLNLRVSAWHRISRSIDDEGTVNCRHIGYANVEGKWGIALSKTTEDQQTGEVISDDTWRFADAPLWMCADAIGHLPELIQALIARTQETTQRLRTKNEEAKEIVAATATAAAQIVTSTRRPK
jgi:hypothetical protein